MTWVPSQKPQRHKVSEHRDVVIGHVTVGDRAHLAVAKMIPGQETVLVEIKPGARA